MICADTSSIIAYLQGERGPDVDEVDRALADRSLALAPASLTELMSDPDVSGDAERFLLALPRLGATSGYWERAGRLRRELWTRRHRPKVADTLIAQSCLDHQVPLVTRDQDFRAFQKHAGLRLV